MESASQSDSVKQLIIENQVLLVCPHCWTREQIAREYPELAKFPISAHLCDRHYDILRARAIERVGLDLKRPNA